jgi:hypothetical protein
MSQATRDAAISRSNKATAAKDLPSFVMQTKMNLELQMVALQAQLEIVSEIDGMKEDEKIDICCIPCCIERLVLVGVFPFFNRPRSGKI